MLAAAAFVLLNTFANGHLFLSSPPILGQKIKDPLDANGDNFPCHNVAFPGSGGMAMPVGSTQLLAFDDGGGANWASHGGGSCQLSVTYETLPEKIKDPMNWYVILSIEEGCPTNSPANLNGQFPAPDGSGTYTGAHQCNDSSTNGYDCYNSFNFEIPKGMKNGQATLAWTWFNNVGNREMYQNCVAIDITGGESDYSQMQDMPGMFVANLGGDYPSDCITTAYSNVAFPQPGPVVEYKKPSPRIPIASASTSFPIATPAGCPDRSHGGSSAQPSIINDSSPASVVPSGVASGAAGSLPTMAINGKNVVANNNDAGSSNAIPTAVAAGSSVQAASVSDTAYSSNPSDTADSSGGSSQGSCAAGSVACTTPGAMVCVDSQHFGTCDINMCAVSLPVAAGTQCQDGAIGFAPGVSKRGLTSHRYFRHGRRHLPRLVRVNLNCTPILTPCLVHGDA